MHSTLAARQVSGQTCTSSCSPCHRASSTTRQHRCTRPQHRPGNAALTAANSCSSTRRHNVIVHSMDPAQQQHGHGGSAGAGDGGRGSRAGGIGGGGGFSWPPWANDGADDDNGRSVAQWHTSVPLALSIIVLGVILDITGMNAKSAWHQGKDAKGSGQQPPQQEQQQQLAGDATTAADAPSIPLLGGLQRSVRDDIMALKRLLRELFAEQLTTKGRLIALEQAATADAAAGVGDGAVSTVSAPGSAAAEGLARASNVRVTGHVAAGMALPWSQEEDASAAAGTMASCGAGGIAHMALHIHSVSADQKRHLTAKLVQLQQQRNSGDMPTGLHVQQLLYRAQVNKWLHMLIAPLGGCLEAISRPINPLAGQHGIMHAVRRGHGVNAVSQRRTGMALTVAPQGPLSFSAGHFVAGTGQHSTAQLSVHTQSQCAASLVVAHTRSVQGASSSAAVNAVNADLPVDSGGRMPLRWAGLQSPSTGCSAADTTNNSSPGARIGVAGVAPIRDMLIMSGWAEHPVLAPTSVGAFGWGVALTTQPDQQGQVVGVAVMRPGAAPQQHARAARAAQPLLCELSCALPAGDGLALNPGAVLAVRDGGKTSLALCLQSMWRF